MCAPYKQDWIKLTSLCQSNVSRRWPFLVVLAHSDADKLKFYIDQIGYTYILSAICIIGILLNCLSVLVFSRLRGDMHKLFKYKTIGEVAIMVIGLVIGVLKTHECDICSSGLSSYWHLVFKKYFQYYAVLGFHIFADLCEILIILDRLMMFQIDPTLNVRTYLSYKFNLLVALIISFVSILPILFSSEIQLNDQNTAEIVSTNFGSSRLFNIYLFIIPIMKNGIMFTLIIILNWMLMRSFRSYIRNHNRISVRSYQEASLELTSNSLIRQSIQTPSDQQAQSHPSRRLTEMIIVLNFLIIYSRLVQSTVTLIMLVNRDKEWTGELGNVIYLMKFLANANSLVIFTLNFFTYWHYNKMFREAFKALFKPYSPSKVFLF